MNALHVRPAMQQVPLRLARSPLSPRASRASSLQPGRPLQRVVCMAKRERKRTRKTQGPGKTEFAEEVKPAVEGAVAPTGKEATLALFRDAQAMGGMQQAYLSPSSEDQAFNDKLEALKAAAGTQPRLAMPKGASPLDAGSLLEGATPLGGKYGPGTGGSVDDEKDNSRLPLQIGAVLIVIIFVALYSGSDLQNSTNRITIPGSGSGAELPADVAAQYEKDASKFETALTFDPNDADAVEGAAVSYAQLGKFVKADEKLQKLVALRPTDVEAVRLLAETKAQQGELQAAASYYERALQLSPDSLELFRGYITVLRTDGKDAQAVAALLEAKPRAAARGNMGIEGSSSDPLDDVQLQLLLGKVYSEWKGHSGDAITVYNGLIDEYKQDFRGFLAKGSLLKEIGKEKDAQRMFLQARFLAPDAAKPLVEQVASRPASQPVAKGLNKFGAVKIVNDVLGS